MSSLPRPYGPAAETPPEPKIVYTCACGAEFRWEPQLHQCQVCKVELCSECQVGLCEGCGGWLCEKHQREIDGLTLCPPCAREHEANLLDDAVEGAALTAAERVHQMPIITVAIVHGQMKVTTGRVA